MTEIYNLNEGEFVAGTFYYPDGKKIEGEDAVQKFIEEYSKIYYIGNL